MNIEELKHDLCDMIDEAYLLAKDEGHDEIVQPFSIAIHKDGTLDYLPLSARKKPARLHL